MESLKIFNTKECDLFLSESFNKMMNDKLEETSFSMKKIIIDNKEYDFNIKLSITEKK